MPQCCAAVCGVICSGNRAIHTVGKFCNAVLLITTAVSAVKLDIRYMRMYHHSTSLYLHMFCGGDCWMHAAGAFDAKAN